MALCTNCGSEAAEHEKLCESCGHAIAASVSENPLDTAIRSDFSMEKDNKPNTIGQRLKQLNKIRFKYFFTLLAIIIVCMSLSIYFNNSDKSNASLDNLFNGSRYVAMQGNWIYYITDNGLYKMDNNNGESTKIEDGEYTFIYVSGDWIHLMSYLDKPSAIEIKTDGSKKTTTSSLLFGSIGNTSYYEDIKDRTYFKTSIIGIKTKLIFENDEFPLGIANKKIYTLGIRVPGNSDDNKGINLYEYDKNRKSRNLIFSGVVALKGYSISFSFHAEGNSIYYITPTGDGTYGPLTLSDTNSKGTTYLTDDSINEFNISNGWIYYCQGNSIFKMRLNSKDATKIYSSNSAAGKPSQLTVLGKWIFFMDDLNLCRINTDGSGFEKLGHPVIPNIEMGANNFIYAELCR